MTDFFYKKCDVVRDLLPIYADHGTAPETTSLVAQHIAKCESCSKYLGFIRKSNEKKRAEIKAELTPDYLDFMRALKRRRKFGKIFLISSTVVSAVAVGIVANKLNEKLK